MKRTYSRALWCAAFVAGAGGLGAACSGSGSSGNGVSRDSGPQDGTSAADGESSDGASLQDMFVPNDVNQAEVSGDAESPDVASSTDATDGEAPTDASEAGGDASHPGSDASPDAAADSASPCLTPSPMNLLTNPGFNTSTTGWTAPLYDFTVTWNKLDATGCPTSGSLALKNIDDAGINNGAAQCVAVTAGTTYDYGFKTYIPTPPPPGQVYLQMEFYGAANCQSPYTGFAQLTADTTKTDEWQSLAGTLMAPAGTVSAHLYFQVVQGTGSGFTPLFDDAYISPSPATF